MHAKDAGLAEELLVKRRAACTRRYNNHNANNGTTTTTTTTTNDNDNDNDNDNNNNSIPIKRRDGKRPKRRGQPS